MSIVVLYFLHHILLILNYCHLFPYIIVLYYFEFVLLSKTRTKKQYFLFFEIFFSSYFIPLAILQLDSIDHYDPNKIFSLQYHDRIYNNVHQLKVHLLHSNENILMSIKNFTTKRIINQAQNINQTIMQFYSPLFAIFRKDSCKT